MTDKTCTEDDVAKFIKAIFSGEYDHMTCAELRVELGKPKPSFREGEVYARRNRSESRWAYVQAKKEVPGSDEMIERRPLKISELPGYVHDLADAMRRLEIQEYICSNHDDDEEELSGRIAIAESALAAYHKAGGEG